jgi:hypothetical protein
MLATFRKERSGAAAAVDAAEAQAIEAAYLKAYRWQYIHSGAQHPQFGKVLSSLITENQTSAFKRRSPRSNNLA